MWGFLGGQGLCIATAASLHFGRRAPNDDTDLAIVDDLLARGIPKQDMVLG